MTIIPRRTWILAALFAALGAAVSAQEPNASGQTPSIVTTGEAIIRRAPDQAFVSVAVETRAPRPARRAAPERRCHERGAAEDRRSRHRPRRGPDDRLFDSAGVRLQRTAGARRESYVARNGVEVRLDAVERTGEILDVVVQAGATSVSGVRFDLKDRVVGRARGAAACGGRCARPRRCDGGRSRPHHRSRAAHRRHAAGPRHAAAADDDARRRRGARQRRRRSRPA